MVTSGFGAPALAAHQGLWHRQARGCFIAFTGTDGAGKSTQASLLAGRLKSQGLRAFAAEPKDDLIPQILGTWSDERGRLSQEDLGLLIAAEVLRFLGTTVIPLLTAGVHVVCPRSIFCQIGIAKALGNREAERLDGIMSVFGDPDLTILLDLPTELTMERIELRGTDSEEFGLMRKFREELCTLAAERELEIVDGQPPPNVVSEQVWRLVTQKLA